MEQFKKNTGKIIVVEGTDGSGKLTQSTKLFERLLDKYGNVKRLSFPQYESASSGPVKMYLGGELSEDAKDVSAKQASVLYAADRVCTMLKLKEFYNNKGIIVLDRYVQSNMIHQAGKVQRVERSGFLDWLNDFEFVDLGLPKADIVFFLDMPVEKSMELAASRGVLKTGTKQDIHEKDPQHLIDAYNAGKYCAEKYGWLVIKCLDEKGKLRSIEDIHNEIYAKVKGVLPTGKNRNL